MKACCYILFSEKLGKFYIGATQDNLDNRIRKHNLYLYGSHRFTAVTNDWKLFISIPATDFAHAVRIERYIKSQKSSKYIRNLKVYPELIDKIIEKSST